METILPDQTGFLATPNSVDSLAAALQKALALNTQAREKMAQKSMEHVREHFSKEAMCAGEFAVYKKIVKSTTQRAKRAA
jgi:glycosyltransferase involved in cell wall biosynthesis